MRMDVLKDLMDMVTTPQGLIELVASGGYVALVLIIFAETGLMAGFFLPGDSLLVTAGLAAATGALDIGTLNVLLIIAAVLGDAVGYAFGRRSGKRILTKPPSRFFKRSHLEKSREFYNRHGARTVVLARFIPVIRTFAPVVAGMSGMPYRKFVLYNVIGGVLWITSLTLIGYWLGQTIPNITRYFHLVIGAIIVMSIIPPIVEFLRERARKRAQKRAPTTVKRSVVV
jgi:membrane-associated protein